MSESVGCRNTNKPFPLPSYSTEKPVLTPTTVEVPKPRIIDSHDVIVKVTGSTVCGSDVHLMHGVILQTEKGDILGHEFCGVVESVGPAVTKLSPGDRVVNSFCISCGECRYCKEKLPTACEKTNASKLHAKLYGGRLSGIFGYSHFVGGYAGGQAEFVRVPLADNNLMKLPDLVPDEKGRWGGLLLRISPSGVALFQAWFCC
jgi:threonine dehydrogenase-like Zn-dependent dehydrogenase